MADMRQKLCNIIGKKVMVTDAGAAGIEILLLNDEYFRIYWGMKTDDHSYQKLVGVEDDCFDAKSYRGGSDKEVGGSRITYSISFVRKISSY